MKTPPSIFVGALVAVSTLRCGGGVPVRIVIDEFSMEVALDDVLDNAFREMQAQGLFPAESRGLPVIWPDSLPEVQYRAVLATAPVPVDLTPDPDSEEAAKYEEINAVEDAIRRIEMNRLILRVEDSSLNIALPELKLQVADAKDARPDDRLAWRTVGTLAAAEPGFIGDVELAWVPSGESFLNAQLADDTKEFALRVAGRIDIDTTQNGGRLPSGRAMIRLIVVATFFIEPEGAI